MNTSGIFKLSIIILLLAFIGCSSTKNTNLLRGYLERGDMYYKAGGFDNYQRSENQYRHALNIDLTNIEALVSLGSIYYIYYEHYLQQEDNSTALSYLNISYNCFNQTLKHEPDYPEPYFMLARLNYCIKKYDEGIKLLQKVLTLSSADIITQAMAHRELGRLYNAQKKYPEALSEFEEYLRILPEPEDAYKIKRAIKELEKGIASSSEKEE